MLKLLNYLKLYKIESILGPLFKLIEACFELAIPLVMANMIEQGIYKQNLEYIIKQGFLMLALGFLGLLFSITAQFFSAKAAIGMATRIREDLFAHIMKFSFKTQDKNEPATLITRLTQDINQVQNCVNMCLRLLLRSPFIVFGAMLMAFYVDANNAIIFAIIIPLLFVIVLGIIFLTIPFHAKVQKETDNLILKVHENITGIRVVRAFARQMQERAEFKKTNEELSIQQITAGKVVAFMNPITYCLINIGLVIILYQGALKIELGFMTQGALVALINYMSQILVELIKMASLIIYIAKAITSADRIESIFCIDPDSGSANVQHTESDVLERGATVNMNSIVLDQVSFCYPGEQKKTLDSISFSAVKGEMIGIAGSMGMGKTTLLHLIAGFYSPTGGNITILDDSNHPMLEVDLQKNTAFVFQETALFEGTIRENLIFGQRTIPEDKLLRALELSVANEFVEKMPGGIKSHLSKMGKNLSGGQKQRLAIARALVKDSPIYILDDSFSALDYITELKVRRNLKEIAKDKIIFVASQRISSLMEMDKILVLEQGKCVGFDHHDKLLLQCQTYRELCQYQGVQEEVNQKA